MGIEEIWERLAPSTRDWLVENNGDAIPADIAAEIDDVADATNADEVWAVESGSEDLSAALESDEREDADDDPAARYLAEEVVDWIEEFANEE